ncbi:MAG: F0F1 ATP synthase subunit B [Bacteroidales bacterium]|jgi:F-type H+-transporting ATPase subunit b|nr:F0F1 ATP synthase subunit B [Bacteroidales bacterium]
MSLLTPDGGLVFWMLLAFGIVFFILAKFAWPVITGAAEKRTNFINTSMESAKEANRKLAEIKTEADGIIADAYEQRTQIMKETAESRDKIISDAKDKASSEARKIIEDANVQIERQKQEVMASYRKEVSEAAVQIAEKILRRELAKDGEQMALINSMLDELNKQQ